MTDRHAHTTANLERFNKPWEIDIVSTAFEFLLELVESKLDSCEVIYSDVVFWRVPSELTSRQARLLLGKQIAKEIFYSLPELESFVRIQDQRLYECLGLLTTRFPNGFDG